MNFATNNPIYLQIGDRICENIIREKWAEGAKIPSVRDMAVESEVNPNTIMRTYSYLQEKGIIFNRRGIGYFVSEKALNTAKGLKQQEFLNQDLPIVFRVMDLLDLSVSDLEPFYVDYRKRNNGGK